MAGITCPQCNGTGTDPNTQSPCILCGGDGILDLIDPGFLEQQIAGMVESGGYLVWAVMYLGLLNEMEKLNDLVTKLDTFDTKMDTLDTHLDIIENKIDAL